MSSHCIAPAFVSAWLPFCTPKSIQNFVGSPSSTGYYFYNKETSGTTKLEKPKENKNTPPQKKNQHTNQNKPKQKTQPNKKPKQQKHECQTVISEGREILGIPNLLKKLIYES